MTPRELVADYLAAAKRRDWEDAFGYFADDILIHIPDGPSPPVIIVGRTPPWLHPDHARPLPGGRDRVGADRHARQREARGSARL
ncbi:MAG: hypothetical protein ABWY65_09750, partial [Thermoleophilaceae bacterium]